MISIYWVFPIHASALERLHTWIKVLFPSSPLLIWFVYYWIIDSNNIIIHLFLLNRNFYVQEHPFQYTDSTFMYLIVDVYRIDYYQFFNAVYLNNNWEGTNPTLNRLKLWTGTEWIQCAEYLKQNEEK